MPRVGLPAALLVLLVVATVGLVRDHSDNRPISPEAERPTTPLLSARRVPLLLAGPAADVRLAETLIELDRRSPPESCLIVSDETRVLFERRADIALLPASATKVLTAAAALEADDSRDERKTADLVMKMLRESDNDAAVALLRRIGGEAAAMEALSEASLPVDGVRIVDGSGLDRANRATCRSIHAILVRAPTDGPITDGLAVAGRSGTLADRYRGSALEGRLRAKTGSIRGVASLAGYVETTNGSLLTFVHILNETSADAAEALQDEVVSTLVTYPDAAVARELGPRGS